MKKVLIFQPKRRVINNYKISATLVQTNSKKCSSALLNGLVVLESISICPTFFPLTKTGITIFSFNVNAAC